MAKIYLSCKICCRKMAQKLPRVEFCFSVFTQVINTFLRGEYKKG